MMGITETGLRLAMLHSLRDEDERILQRRINSLNEAMAERNRAESNVRASLSDVQYMRRRIAETTLEMNRLIERGAS